MGGVRGISILAGVSLDDLLLSTESRAAARVLPVKGMIENRNRSPIHLKVTLELVFEERNVLLCRCRR